jgi:uncharacterized protein YndB with AHSA1/START domain
MKILDTTAPAQTDAISFELDLRHSPKKVWRALTEPALLEKWLLPATGFSLTPGKDFILKTQAFPGWDGTVHCRLVEIEAERKLSYSWVVGDMELDTMVTFVLRPTDEGTHLSIVQSGFKPSQKQNFGGARYGWKSMAGKLIDVLDGLETASAT